MLDLALQQVEHLRMKVGLVEERSARGHSDGAMGRYLSLAERSSMAVLALAVGPPLN